MVWLQIQAKSECSTRSYEESVLESKKEDDKEEDISLELIAPHMVQTIPSLSSKKKSVIKLEDKSGNSESDISVFVAKLFKRLKKETLVSKPATKTSKDKAVADKAELLTVASSVLVSDKKKLIKQAKKMLEGKATSYTCSFKKPDMETSMLCILQQQMC
eukprot:2695487-Ditylum_brightwellii.AAC.2